MTRIGGVLRERLSPSNAEWLLGKILAHLSLPAKNRFPEAETSSFGDWFERPLIERKDRASGAAGTLGRHVSRVVPMPRGS